MKTRLLIIFYLLIHFSVKSIAHDDIISLKLSCKDGLPDNAMRYIAQDSVGNIIFLWLTGASSYDGYNFMIFDDDEFRRLEKRYMSRPAVQPSVHTDNRGNVVEVDYRIGDVRYFDKNSGRLYTIHKAFDNRMVTLSNNVKVTVLTDKRDLVWVSINGNGIFLLDKTTGKITHINADDPKKLIDSDYVVSMMEDRRGNIWVSQDKYGIAVLSVVDKPYYVIEPSPDSKIERQRSVRLLHRLADGRVIIADDYASVYVSNDDLRTLTPYIKNGKENYISAEVDRLGRLWLGSRTRGVVLGNTSIGSGRIDCIVRDRMGRMWICGLDGGIFMYECYEDGSVNEKRFLGGIENLSPRTIMESRENNMMWLGSGKGLFLFNDTGEKYERIIEEPVLAICDDGNGGVWCGTQGYGVIHVESEDNGYRIVRFTVNDGLTHNTVNSLIVNNNGKIIAGTNDGISIYHPSDNQWRSLRVNDNSLRNYYNENCVTILGDGRCAFGTLDGVVVAAGDEVEGSSDSDVLPLAVTGIEIDGIPIGPDILRSVCKDGVLVMDHDNSSLTVRVSDFSFNIIDKSLYSFMLDGYDHRRGPWTDMNFASYPNIPPGKYTLKVWSKAGVAEPYELAVEVKKAPWATSWAITGYLTFFLIISMVVGRYVRKQALLRRELAFEKRLTDFKIKFFTDISHEFKVSLTLIMASMYRVKSQLEMSGMMRYRVRGMEHNVNRMTRLVNQLMDFKKLEDDKLRLSLQPTEITTFLRNVYAEFLDFAKKKMVSLSYYSELKTTVVDVDRGVLDKIAYNLLSNALNYTLSGNSVIMSVRMDGMCLVISVADTGIGITEELRQNIFKRYTVSRQNPDSTGIGLSFTKELVTAHHGEISYRENVPSGSVFEVKIPVGEGEYEKSDYLDSTSILMDDDKSDSAIEISENVGGVVSKPINSHKLLFVDYSEEKNSLGDELVSELNKTFDVRRCSANELKDVCGICKFDLLICHEPSISAIRNIRKIEGMEIVPILLLIDGDNLDRADALRAGADAVIEKPFSIHLLFSQCIGLINRYNHLTERTRLSTGKPDKVSLPVMTDADRLFIDRLDSFIEEHKAVSIDAVCEYFGFSRASLTRRTNSIIGCSPKDYITRRKMEMAQRLINEGEYVSDVAEKLGFSSPQNFATAFKRYFGKSPLQYKFGK